MVTTTVTQTIEQETRLVPLDENFAATMEKIMAEGWKMQPGVKPVGIYYLIRDPNEPKPVAGDMMGAIGKIAVDPNLVGIIRAGSDKIEWGSGTITDKDSGEIPETPLK